MMKTDFSDFNQQKRRKAWWLWGDIVTRINVACTSVGEVVVLVAIILAGVDVFYQY